MPVDPIKEDKSTEVKLEELIRFCNELEVRLKLYEDFFNIIPGDYPANTLLGIKTSEGKVYPYTLAQLSAALSTNDYLVTQVFGG
jgi:hypothetical protein